MNSMNQTELPPFDLDRLDRTYPSRQHADELEDRPRERPSERPFGVTVIAVLNIVGAALLALVFAASLSTGSANGVAIVAALAGTAIAVGLWKLKKWAYWLAVAGYGLKVLGCLLILAAGASAGVAILQIVYGAACLIYLLRPGVRAAFD